METFIKDIVRPTNL